MAVLYTPHFVQFFDNSGSPLSGGKLYTFAAGTTTPKDTYTTADGSIANTNPVVLDSAGRATLFIEGAYKFELRDSSDVLIKTTDNVTSFTTTGETGDSFFQSFSGDGTTQTFTLSQDLGTDEKQIMVFVDNGRQEASSNGSFATDTGWTKGSGWTIGSGVATAAGAISTAISQDASVSLVEGRAYVVKMTITRSAGGLIPSIGGTAGTTRSADGTYSEIIIAGSTQAIAFTGSSFTGTLDNVSVLPIDSLGLNILRPEEYTISGTSLSLSSAPSSGTNNIQVWAPSLLAASASASASAAASSASEAAASAVLAASSVSDATDVSTSSVEIGTGTKVFTVSSGKAFVEGMYLSVIDQADAANYMLGFVTDYTGTSLTITSQSTGGSGTISAWNITPSAPYLSFIASQAEAEAGVSDLKIMTPLKTKQAQDAYTGTVASSRLVGTTTNDSASSGYVGEILTATGTGVSLTSGVDNNVTSLPLTAGDWDVYGWVTYSPAATTSISRIYGGINSTSAAVNFAQAFSDACAAFVPGAITISHPVPKVTVKIAAPTTYYLCAGAAFTVSTMTCGGTLEARRAR